MSIKKTLARFLSLIFFTSVLLPLYGCAGLDFHVADVAFENPLQRLGVVNVEANSEEQKGVLLRLKPPPANILKSREETTLYALIPQKENQGVQVKLTELQTSSYAPGDRPNSCRVRSESLIKKQSGAIIDKLIDELEVTDRNEIVKLIQGLHDTRSGKFKVTNWTRTPVLPEKPVKIGDTWNFEESMTLMMDPKAALSEHKFEAKSRLAGFAEVKGRRCAVIETEARQIETERSRVFFKNRILYNRVQVQETAYLDYGTNVRVAAITKIQTDTNSADGKIDIHSIAQSIYYLLAST
jgi:hypothetical protein